MIDFVAFYPGPPLLYKLKHLRFQYLQALGCL